MSSESVDVITACSRQLKRRAVFRFYAVCIWCAFCPEGTLAENTLAYIGRYMSFCYLTAVGPLSEPALA